MPLSRIKAEPSLRSIRLVRVPRLSVMPLEKEQFQKIVSMDGGKARLAYASVCRYNRGPSGILGLLVLADASDRHPPRRKMAR